MYYTISKKERHQKYLNSIQGLIETKRRLYDLAFKGYILHKNGKLETIIDKEAQSAINYIDKLIDREKEICFGHMID